jgi:hypothetical protein
MTRAFNHAWLLLKQVSGPAAGALARQVLSNKNPQNIQSIYGMPPGGIPQSVTDAITPYNAHLMGGPSPEEDLQHQIYDRDNANRRLGTQTPESEEERHAMLARLYESMGSARGIAPGEYDKNTHYQMMHGPGDPTMGRVNYATPYLVPEKLDESGMPVGQQ